MKVPFFDHKKIHDPIEDELIAAIKSVLQQDSIVLADQVSRFEQSIASYLSTEYAVGVHSGLDAMIISLRALGIGPGDEVIVPSNTYIATWLAVSHVGAMPIPVEPDIATYNIDPKKIEDHITPNTKAILPVHLYGLPCDMSALMKLASKYKLAVVEDNAQAFGAKHKERYTGTFGHCNAHSFYPTKNLGAIGDAGMITTADLKLNQRCRSLRNYGSLTRYENVDLGYNSRLDEMQAAILNVKLKYAAKAIEQKKQLAQYYMVGLANVGDIILPMADHEHTYHLFTIRTQYRNSLVDYLTSRGIATLIHYPIPSHMQACYAIMSKGRGSYPIAEQIADTIVSLPLYIGMEGLEIVIKAIKKYY